MRQLFHRGLGSMALNGISRNKKISAQFLLWVVALAIGLVTGLASFFYVFRAFDQMKQDAANYQSEMLGSTARASLQTDLLSSNFFLASERLKSMLEPEQWAAYCVKVKSVDNESKTIITFGASEVCENKELISFQRKIFFDAEMTTPAYTVITTADPARLPYKPSTKIVAALFFSFVAIFTALVFIILLSNLFLSNVFSILQGAGVSRHSSWLSNLLEFDAINRVIAERDEQQKIAQRAIAEAELTKSVSELASQVSHDIRSPLSALNMAVSRLDGLEEDRRLLIRSATQRINDIANQLLRKGREATQAKGSQTQVREPVMLISLLDSIVSEKRVEFRDRSGIEIQDSLGDGYGLFASLDESELGRALSNLINNSVEAISASGKIEVQLRPEGQSAVIHVIDNGRGIIAADLRRLGEPGFSSGKGNKSSGFGLGIRHAKSVIESAGGTLAIESEYGEGTRVTIRLPRVSPPWLFLSQVNLDGIRTVVCVDDDRSIHQIWSGRLKSNRNFDPEFVSFLSVEKFEAWLTSHDLSNTLFLIDYEFQGQNANGLDLIERLGLSAQTVLVTSRSDERKVRTRAGALRVKVLPKGLASFVPFG